MSHAHYILVGCNDLVTRLLHKRIRVSISNFDGYGFVEEIHDGEEALILLEK